MILYKKEHVLYTLWMTIEMPVSEARARFSEVMDFAWQEPVILTRHGRRSVVMLSADEYDRLMEIAEDVEDIAESDKILAEISNGAPTFTLEEVRAELGLG